MFRKPGRKIKTMAKVLFCLDAIACVLLACALQADAYYPEERTLIFLIVLVVGLLVAYCSSLMVYGFGELVDKVSEIQKSN